MLPRAPQLGCGFPWNSGAAGAQRSHWLQDAVPKSQRNWMPVRHQHPWEAPAGSPGSSGVSGSCVCFLVINNAKEKSTRRGTAGAALGKGSETAPKQSVGENPQPWLSSALESAPIGRVQPGSSSLSMDKSFPEGNCAQVISQWPQPGGPELHELLREVCLLSSPSHCKRAGSC